MENDPSSEPGGLPQFEQASLNAFFKTATVILSNRQALSLFRRESDNLIQLAIDDESFDVFQRLKIPRVIGIEESSRNWSVMMVLEHLCLTNRDILDVIVALSDGVVPRGSIDIAMYKPSADAGYDSLDQFRALSAEYEDTIGNLIESRGSLNTPARFPHPWFGSLNAKQWHFLAGAHMVIHRRQMQKLVAMLGVT